MQEKLEKNCCAQLRTITDFLRTHHVFEMYYQRTSCVLYAVIIKIIKPLHSFKLDKSTKKKLYLISKKLLCEFFWPFIIIYFCTMVQRSEILHLKKCYFIGLKSFKLKKVPNVARLFQE